MYLTKHDKQKNKKDQLYVHTDPAWTGLLVYKGFWHLSACLAACETS